MQPLLFRGRFEEPRFDDPRDIGSVEGELLDLRPSDAFGLPPMFQLGPIEELDPEEKREFVSSIIKPPLRFREALLGGPEILQDEGKFAEPPTRFVPRIPIQFEDPRSIAEIEVESMIPPTRKEALFQNVLEHIAESKGPEIGVDDFNRTLIQRFFANTIDDAGDLTISRGDFENELEQILESGILAAQQMPNSREGFHAVLRTLVNSVPITNPPVIREVIESILNRSGKVPGLRGDVADLVDENLPLDAIAALRAPVIPEQKRERLVSFFENRVINQIDDPSELAEWRAYLGSHVGSARLRDELLDKLNMRSAVLEPPPAVIGAVSQPAQFTRAIRKVSLPHPDILIARTDLNKFEDLLEQKILDGVDERKDPAIPLVDNAITFYNRGVRKLNITDREGNLLLARVSGPVGFQSLLRAIRDLKTALRQRVGITFDSGPQPGSPQNVTQLISELNRELNKTSTSDGRHVAQPEKVTMIGNIEIAKESEVGPAVREISIPPTTTMGELVKLAIIISMEGGRLESVDGKNILELEDTSVGTIVSFMQELLDMAGGEAIRFLYFPTSKGEFLDGMLMDVVGGSLPFDRSVMFLMGLPMTSYTKFGGGVKISDIAGTVGGIAGTIGDIFPPAQIIAAPVKAISNVIKGIGKLFKF